MAPPRVVRRGTGGISKAADRRLPGFADPDEAFEPFRFVVMADTQLGMLSLTKDQAATGKPARFRDLCPELSSEAAYKKEVEMVDRAIEAVNGLEPLPEFAVVCGDLVNAWPHEPKLQREQKKDLVQSFSRVDSRVSLVCLCGNHDIGQEPTEGAIDEFKTDFGDDYFDFWCRKVRFWVLNSQLHWRSWPEGSEQHRLEREQGRWLDAQLGDGAVAAHHVVLTHIPPFIVDQDEPDGMFNIAPAHRIDLLEKFLAKAEKDRAAAAEGSPRVIWFAGHYHRDVVTKYKDVEIVTNAAVGCNFDSDEQGDLWELSGISAIGCLADRSGIREIGRAHV